MHFQQKTFKTRKRTASDQVRTLNLSCFQHILRETFQSNCWRRNQRIGLTIDFPSCTLRSKLIKTTHKITKNSLRSGKDFEPILVSAYSQGNFQTIFGDKTRGQGSPQTSLVQLYLADTENNIQEQCLVQTVGQGNASFPNCLDYI